MTDDFNIRDSSWNPNFHHHSVYTDNLITITDSLGLELFPLSIPKCENLQITSPLF